MWKLQTSGVQSLAGISVFDGSTQTVNFFPIPVVGNPFGNPVVGNQPFRSSAAITSLVSINTLNSRQQQ